jgi:predicted nucleic acid-binding protein
MSAFVVDASVVIKWFAPEIHRDAARRLLALSPRAGSEFSAPLILRSLANRNQMART